MTALPGELILQSPWREDSFDKSPVNVSPRSSKKPRLSALPAISITPRLRAPGSSSVHVEWGQHVKLFVTQSAPKPQPQSISHDRGCIEVNVSFSSFAVRGVLKATGAQDTEEMYEEEISRIVTDALALSVDLTVYPKSVIEFNVQILEAQKSGINMISQIVPALICGATVALELSDIAKTGRVLAVGDKETGVIGFELGSNLVSVLHAKGLPDVNWGLSACRELEKQLVEGGHLSHRGSTMA